MAERVSAKTRKKRWEKNNARINEKKKSERSQNYTQALGELKCAYTKKKWLFYFWKSTGVLIFEGGALWTIYDLDSNILTILWHLWPSCITFEGIIAFVANFHYIWGLYYICCFNSIVLFRKIYENFVRNDELVCVTKWRGVNFINRE